MHPSKSIIFFTVFSGTGYGILLCLSYLAFVTDINFDNMINVLDIVLLVNLILELWVQYLMIL